MPSYTAFPPPSGKGILLRRFSASLIFNIPFVHNLAYLAYRLRGPTNFCSVKLHRGFI
ncbi:hypothetical protein BJX66DRAFT_304496 [Aspergillus keveii]|uniref:Uncharacterized protein n=1 Tax=Aspergillus keveii TaxID=714993 RepID=A0ABR4G540_9EURO